MIGVVLSRLAVCIVCTSSESERLKKKRRKKLHSPPYTHAHLCRQPHTHTHTHAQQKKGEKAADFSLFSFFSLWGAAHCGSSCHSETSFDPLFSPLFFSSSCFFLFFSLCVLMLVSARCTNDVASTFTNCVSLFKKPVRCSTSSRGRNMKLHCL